MSLDSHWNKVGAINQARIAEEKAAEAKFWAEFTAQAAQDVNLSGKAANDQLVVVRDPSTGDPQQQLSVPFYLDPRFQELVQGKLSEWKFLWGRAPGALDSEQDGWLTLVKGSEILNALWGLCCPYYRFHVQFNREGTVTGKTVFGLGGEGAAGSSSDPLNFVVAKSLQQDEFKRVVKILNIYSQQWVSANGQSSQATEMSPQKVASVSPPKQAMLR